LQQHTGKGGGNAASAKSTSSAVSGPEEDQVFGRSISRRVTAAIALWSDHAALDVGPDVASPPDLAITMAAMLRQPVVEVLLDDVDRIGGVADMCAATRDALVRSKASACEHLVALHSARPDERCAAERPLLRLLFSADTERALQLFNSRVRLAACRPSPSHGARRALCRRQP
jgi:hypothetical protein